MPKKPPQLQPADTSSPRPAEPIAIVGIGCRYPGGIGSPAQFWRFLLEGRNAVTEIPADRLPLDQLFDARPATPGRIMTRWGGFIDQVEQFDAEFFGISPREAQWLDPQQRLLLEVTWEALEAGGLSASTLRGSTTGVYVGTWLNDYEARMYRDPVAIDFYMTTGTGRYAVSGRVSHLFGWTGPSVTVDCACSSSLVSVHLACQALRARECSMAVAGGVNVILEPAIMIAYSQSRMMAPDGRCKFGDSRADGYVRSDGAGVVVLKRLSDALAAGDTIEAVIAGSAVNNDGGSSGSFGTPGRAGQEDMLRKAYRHAGISPGTVWYSEAHGTGTRAGDPVEIQALAAVMGEGRPKNRPLLIGSVKTNIGHTEGAAGVAGLIKAALATKHGLLPQNLNLDQLNPAIPWDQLSVAIPREPKAWSGDETPVAGVSSFGIAGTNAHIVVRALRADERADAARQVTPAADAPPTPVVIPISGASTQALAALAQAWLEREARGDFADGALRDAAWTASTGRSHLDERLAVVASSPADLRAALEAHLAGEKRRGLNAGRRLTAGADKVVFIFPGQGSQWLGMGRALFAREPAFRTSFEACDAAIRKVAGWSVLEAIQATPETARFDDITVIQPTLFAMQVALAALWRGWGITPAAIVGHSMGEVAAAHVAGALSLEDAAQVICRRSVLMKRVSGRGAMAVIEQSLEQARETVKPFGNRLSIAVSNSSRSTVVSGDADAIDELLPQLEKREIFARRVKVDVASHSPHMDAVKDELGAVLHALRPQAESIRLLSTVTAAPIAGAELGPAYWMRNLREPVLFSKVVRLLAGEGHGVFLEISPHPVLVTAINQEIEATGARATALGTLVRDEDEAISALDALGALHVHGVNIDWSRLHPQGGRRIELPTYAWQRERFWYEGVAWNATAVAKPATVDASSSTASTSHENSLHEYVWREAPAVASPRARVGRAYLILSDTSGLGVALATRLQAGGNSATAIAAAPTDHDWSNYAAVIHLGSLDAPAFEHNGAGALAAHGERDALSITSIARTLAAREDQTLPRLYLVTAGAQAAAGLADVTAPTGGALWGFARVLGSEFPRLRCTSIDLDAATARDQVAALAAEILADDTERQVALRRDRRLVPRVLTHTTAPSDAGALRHLWGTARPAGAEPFHASVRHPGILESVVLEPMSRRAPGPGEMEIAVAASGLNFMNVLSALGACPGYPRGVGPLGGDCAGRVERIGAGVSGYEPGDFVMAAALDSLATHVTVDARLVAAVPAALSPEQAASVPIAFLTAWNALEVLAGVRAGDTVLIHAATGGVGQAALQLARRAGATVIASAGSPAKRAWLEQQGVSTLVDSRSNAFVEAVRAATNGRGVDIVLNCLAGELLDASLGLLAPGGRFVELGKRDLHEGHSIDLRLLREGRAFFSVELDRIMREDAGRVGSWLAEIAALLAQGILHPLATTAFPISRATDALRMMSEARHLGKIVLTQPDPAAAMLPPGIDRARLARGTCLVTGGVGALGLLAARKLVDSGLRHVVLISRRAPGEQAQAEIEAMRALGAAVTIASVDLSSRVAVDELLAGIDRNGPALSGVIHAAGILEDATLETLTPESLRRVLAGKASGAIHLHEATVARDLDFFVLFSSIAPLIGSPGQASYAAANAFLDSLAAHRRGRGLPATSINWGPWSQAGLAATDENRGARLADRGIPGLDNATGLALFERILADAPTQAIASHINWPRFREAWSEVASWPVFSSWQRENAPTATSAGPTIRETVLLLRAGRERIIGLEDAVRGLVARVLRKDPARIDATKQFRSLGLDSLMGLELRGQLERAFAMPVPATLIWNHPDVTALARELARRAEIPLESDPAPPVDTATAQAEDAADLEAMLAELEGLSDEEAQDLLGDDPTGSR